ncbi:unnamed protein product [Rhizoctonia solani]|uniref:Uncharacterized protein n=1 Tax=Rhizoctonia solani TaxID=456999 RepID=A0A8H2XKB1_9AGAM|nr:unnamed protein product [Rhizoctonia solani]CAE7214482.1 unnamed protein product [Rhizoctonia solani]
MSSGLPNGIYGIFCGGDGREEMAVHIPSPGVIGKPVELVPVGGQLRPSPIRVENHGGDAYQLTPAEGPRMPGMPCLAAQKEAMPPMILLLPTGTGMDDITEWAIDRSGPDTFLIHPTPRSGRGELCWTAMDNKIQLKGQTGEPAQQWRIVPLND